MCWLKGDAMKKCCYPGICCLCATEGNDGKDSPSVHPVIDPQMAHQDQTIPKKQTPLRLYTEQDRKYEGDRDIYLGCYSSKPTKLPLTKLMGYKCLTILNYISISLFFLYLYIYIYGKKKSCRNMFIDNLLAGFPLSNWLFILGLNARCAMLRTHGW